MQSYRSEIGPLLLLVANLCRRREPHEVRSLLPVLVFAKFADDADPRLTVRGFQENGIAESTFEAPHLRANNLGIIRFAFPLLRSL
jgi:hypothetical protein